MGSFTFLDPLAIKAGVKEKGQIQIKDKPVFKIIRKSLTQPLTMWQSFRGVFNIFVGSHYTQKGRKGLLDFLLLPLLIRKFLYTTDFFPLACFVAAPFELARILLGIALTIACTPLVFIGFLIKFNSTKKIKEQVLNLPIRYKDDSYTISLRDYLNQEVPKHRKENITTSDFIDAIIMEKEKSALSGKKRDKATNERQLSFFIRKDGNIRDIRTPYFTFKKPIESSGPAYEAFQAYKKF